MEIISRNPNIITTGILKGCPNTLGHEYSIKVNISKVHGQIFSLNIVLKIPKVITLEKVSRIIKKITLIIFFIQIQLKS